MCTSCWEGTPTLDTRPVGILAGEQRGMRVPLVSEELFVWLTLLSGWKHAGACLTGSSRLWWLFFLPEVTGGTKSVQVWDYIVRVDGSNTPYSIVVGTIEVQNTLPPSLRTPIEVHSSNALQFLTTQWSCRLPSRLMMYQKAIKWIKKQAMKQVIVSELKLSN